jgi:IBR domain, a half RING-finger domain
LLKRHLLSPESYSKYMKFTNRQKIYKDPTLKGCPTVDCEGCLKRTNPDTPAVCCDCQKQFCFKCLNTWHPSETCESQIDKGYEEWALPNSETVGTCVNCGIKIEKEGGCPHMICKLCNHEWCWVCKQDFPVHLSTCPNYHLYLEILAF